MVESEIKKYRVRKCQGGGGLTKQNIGVTEDGRKRDREGEEDRWQVGRVAGGGVVELAVLEPKDTQINLKTREKSQEYWYIYGYR